jgi:hypothetical protein
MKKRILLICLCVMLGSALFLSPGRILASAWTITFDGGDPLFYSIGQGSITSGGNPGNCIDGVAEVGYTSASVEVDLGTSTTITNVKLDWLKVTDPTGGMTRSAQFYDSSHSLISSVSVADAQSVGVWRTEDFGSINVPGTRYIVFSVGASLSPLVLHGQMDNLSITASSSNTPTATYTPTSTPDPSLLGWSKPLRSVDQRVSDTVFHQAQLISGSSFAGLAYADTYNLNVGFSMSAGINIFAIVDGTISAVEPFTCSTLPGTNICEFTWSDKNIGRFGVTAQDNFYVTETLTSGQLIHYLIASPFVTVGDTVKAGCLIGTAPALLDNFNNRLGDGVLLFQGMESDNITTFDLGLKLIAEPSGVACRTNTNSSCALVNNATFQATQGGWQLNPGRPETYIPYLVPNGGVFFPLDIAQVLNLDSQAQYKIELIYEVQADSPAQRLAVTLGTTKTLLYLNSTQDKTTYTIPAATYTADLANGLYSFELEGAEDSSRLTLYFACVSDTNDSVVTPGGGCVVLDPYFNQQFTSSPWTVSGAPDPPAIIPGGMAVIPDGGSISQSITLWPGDGGINVNYDLLVTYRRQGIASSGKDIKLSWAFGGSSGDLEPASASQLWTDYTATFGVATNVVTDDLILTGVGSDSAQAAQVSKVCIHTHDGGTPPGYREPLPFTGGCRFCVYSPTGDLATDFSEFQQWLGCQFYQLWECQAKILLRYIWQILANILTLLGFFRLWLSSVIIGLVTWGNGNLIVFARYLEGLITNLGITLQNALTNLRSFTLITGSGAGFWDAIVAIANALNNMVTGLINGIGTPIIGLLQQIVTGLFGVLGAVMGVIGTVLSIVFNWLAVQASILLSLLRNVIGALFMAFNTASVAIPPGAPDCAVPGAVLYYPCLGFYVLDNTIFSGPVMYLIPLFMGIMAWRVLLWAAIRVKAVFE